MDLSALLASLGPMMDPAGGASPSPLPSLPMADSVPMPAAGPGQMPMPGHPLPDPRVPMPQAPDLSQHHHAADFVRQLAPLILSTIAAAKNPLHGAAILNGSTQGMLMARQEQMAADARAADTAKLKQAFIQHALTDVKGITDPHQQAQYLTLLDDVGAQQFGMQKGWTQSLPIPRTSETDRLKGEIEKKLAAFDKDAKWKTVAGTPQEAKISFQLSNGQSMPVSSARRLVGQQFTDETGQAAYAPAPEPKDGTSDEAQYRRVLIDEFKQQHGGRDPGTSELRQIFEDAKSGRRVAPPVGSFEDFLKRSYGAAPTPAQIAKARRDYGDAGRPAPITVTLGGGGADKVDRAAQAVVSGRMAPSQAVAMFGGMGRDAGAFKREMTLRVLDVDPTFNFQEAESNYQYGKSTGVQASVRYMASVQDSMPMLLDRAQKLNNGQFRSLNALVNAGKNQVNDVDLKRFKVDVSLVADEVAKILQGGGTGSATSDAKLKQAGALLNETDDPAAIAGALDDINALIGFRKDSQTKGTYMDPSKGGPRVPPPPGGTQQIGRFKVRVSGGS
jgi:hypothetical protein